MDTSGPWRVRPVVDDCMEASGAMDARRDVRATPGFQAAPADCTLSSPAAPAASPHRAWHPRASSPGNPYPSLFSLQAAAHRKDRSFRFPPLQGRGCCGTNVPSTCTCLPGGSDMGLHGATPRVADPPRSFRGAAPRVVGPYEAPDTWGVPYVCPGGSGEGPSGRCAMTCHAQEVAASPRKSIKNGESRAKAPLRRQLRAATAKVSAPRPR